MGASFDTPVPHQGGLAPADKGSRSIDGRKPSKRRLGVRRNQLPEFLCHQPRLKEATKPESKHGQGRPKQLPALGTGVKENGKNCIDHKIIKYLLESHLLIDAFPHCC